MDPVFWRDKSVLITGHTGFKGAWLSLWLTSLGARVVGYSQHPPTSPSLFELAGVTDGMQSVIGDIRDFEHLRRTIQHWRPEIVFHLAAQALVRRGYRNPIETYHTNVLGTVHLLEAVRQTEGIKAALIVTSDKCYENTERQDAFKETDLLGGRDPYSSSKACAELVTAAYSSSYFKPPSSWTTAVASVRAGNVIGGGDWAEERLLPDIIRGLIARKPVAIRSPHAIRPWQHVLEPLGGYLLLAERLYDDGAQFAGAWNFGPPGNGARTVEEVVRRVLELWDDGTEWIHDSNPQPHESGTLKLDCSKAQQQLGWKPQWGLDQALESTVTWYKAYVRGQDVREFTLKQIDSYQSLIAEAESAVSP